MKLTSINATAVNNNKYRQNNKSTPAFKGGVVDAAIKFWQFVDNGGKAVQFTVEDMCGTNIPRTYKGAMAGYKYTHKINVPALLQEAVREFLTGPIMTITPWAIITYCMAKFNKTSDTHVENIRNLSDIMQSVKGGAVDDVEREFFSKTAADLLQTTVGKNIVESSDVIDDLRNADVESLTDGFVEYARTIKDMAGKKGKDLKEAQALSNSVKEELSQRFESIVKRTQNAYSDSSFLNTCFTKNVNPKTGAKEIGKTNFKNYADYTVNYMQDFAKSNTKNGNVNITKEIVDNFKNFNVGKRVAIISAMFFLTGIAMSFIPKIYTVVSGSTDPNATAIYDKAKENNTKEGGNN